MSVWIVLLRGVNVGGHNKLPMAELRWALEAAGFNRVQTYIQSGNIVLAADRDGPAVAEAVSGLIEREFGFRPDCLALGADALKAALADAPFAPETDPSRAHLFFHMGADLPDISDLSAQPGDKARLTPGEIAHYLDTPDGMSQSKLAEALSRRLKSATTARNLRTCLKLLEMARDAC